MGKAFSAHDSGSVCAEQVDGKPLVPWLPRIHSQRCDEAATLATLSQRCHMLHDRDEHARRRRLTYRRRRALGDLFEGTYPTV